MTLDTRPPIRHRYTAEEALASYRDAEAAYADGNYVFAANLAPAGSELQGCALVMLGAFQRGLSVLCATPDAPALSPRGRQVRAFARWVVDDAGTAVADMEALVRDCPGVPQYRAFLDVLKRQTIEVLLLADPFQRSVAAFKQTSPLFRVRTVGFDRSCDIPITADCDLVATVRSALGRAPDLALSLTSYAIYHRDHGRLPCPKIGFLTDHDYFLFNRHAFAANDLLLTNGPIEHFEVRRLYPRPCHTYYTLDLDYSIPHAEQRGRIPKRFDVGLSGSSFVPYMREKAQFSFALMDLPDDLSIRVIQGFLPGDAYHRFIAESRRMPMAVRFSDVLNTRIIEAVQHGCEGLNLGGNLWPELLGLQAHTAPYRYETLERDIRDALASSSEAGITPQQLADIDRLLPPSPQREVRFLKYFAFLGSQCERVAEHAVASLRCSGSTGILLEIQDRTGPAVAAFHSDLVQHFGAGHTAYDANRELNARIYLARFFREPQLVDSTIAAGERLIARHPNHLVLRFNFARFLFHYVHPERAEAQFRAIIEGAGHWDLREDEDDVLNYHYHIEYFPFMRYQDNVLLKLVAQSDPAHAKPYIEPADLIVSTACHYLAQQSYARDNVADALDVASLGIGYCEENYNLQAALVRICWKCFQQTGNAECLPILVNCFDRAVDDYPGYFRELAWYALQALTQLGDEARLRRLVTLWYRHCSRVLWTDAQPLPPGHQTDLCRAVLRFRADLPEPANQHVDEFVRLLEALPAMAPSERLSVPNHLELLFVNMVPALLDGLADSGLLAEASANLSAYLNKLDLGPLPWLRERLVAFHQQRLASPMNQAH
ncbi:MAG TPA: hypothetical protein VF801_06585 [Rhodocyclaceae bacterium]